MIRRAIDPDFACRTIFAILERTARDGARCPTQRDLGERLVGRAPRQRERGKEA
jgi:hypothetical protein